MQIEEYVDKSLSQEIYEIVCGMAYHSTYGTPEGWVDFESIKQCCGIKGLLNTLALRIVLTRLVDGHSLAVQRVDKSWIAALSGRAWVYRACTGRD